MLNSFNKIVKKIRRIDALLLLPFVLIMLFSSTSIIQTQGQIQDNQNISQESLPTQPIVTVKAYDYEWVVMVYLDAQKDLKLLWDQFLLSCYKKLNYKPGYKFPADSDSLFLN